MLMEVAARLAGTFLRWNPGRPDPVLGLRPSPHSPVCALVQLEKYDTQMTEAFVSEFRSPRCSGVLGEDGTYLEILGFPGCSNAGDPGLTLGREDPLEKGMATHSSVLAWRIPWTEEPVGSDMTM